MKTIFLLALFTTTHFFSLLVQPVNKFLEVYAGNFDSQSTYRPVPGGGSVDPIPRVFTADKTGVSNPNSFAGRAIPGILEAEDFDNGGENTGYHDGTPANIGGAYRPSEAVDIESCTEGGYNVGWIQPGEWLQFSVHVNATGIYSFYSRISTPNSGNSLQLEVDGVPAGDVVPAPNTGGWQNWQTVYIPVSLTEGDHLFRVVFKGNGVNNNLFNINWFYFDAKAYQLPTVNAGPGQTVLTNEEATLSGSGSGTGITYQWEQTDGKPAVIENAASASTHISGLARSGVRTFKLTVKDILNNTATGFVTLTVNNAIPPTPYGGVRWPIPGKLEAEEYDNGGLDVAYNDSTPANIGGAYRPSEEVDIDSCSEGGYNAGWIQNEEWLQFSVHVTTTGNYSFYARISSPNSGNSLQLEVDGVPAGDAVPVPNTGGWQSWQTVYIPVSLTEGDHAFRFVFKGNGINHDLFNVNWFYFDAKEYQLPTANAGTGQSVLTNEVATLSGSGTGTALTYLWEQTDGRPAIIESAASATTNISGLARAGVRTFKLTVKDILDNAATDLVTLAVTNAFSSTPYGGVRWPIPGKLEAEDFDNGGLDVAFNDSTPVNTGGAYRLSEEVDIESCSEGGYNVGWIRNGEWLKFSVNATTTGNYNFTSRVSSPNSDAALQLQVDGAPTGITIPNTGGWQNWTTISIPLFLTAGDHSFRFVFFGNGVNHDLFNVNWFNFELVKATKTPVISQSEITEPEVPKDLDVMVFPNPSASDFRIVVNSTSDEPVTVRIMDLNGAVKSVQPVLPKSNVIRIGANLQTGIYLAEIIQGKKRKVIKLIKVN